MKSHCNERGPDYYTLASLFYEKAHKEGGHLPNATEKIETFHRKVLSISFPMKSDYDIKEEVSTAGHMSSLRSFESYCLRVKNLIEKYRGGYISYGHDERYVKSKVEELEKDKVVKFIESVNWSLDEEEGYGIQKIPRTLDIAISQESTSYIKIPRTRSCRIKASVEYRVDTGHTVPNLSRG
ncbi:hypothetical protein QAD02_014132 [Eretmocerus hayati]|uniref:Uncharacterized protein n=1 Tax=Eretmocerus hayati TaxID=131215 RepID=A0ACC2P993_9HYME|nr:hypothetical protein QAD02_014132 [Eretmocerus hayati]